MRTLKPHERNPGKMTFTTASGLLPAGIAVSSGGRTELVWKCDIQLGCKALRLKAKDAGQIDYCQLPKELKNRVNDFNNLHNPILEFLVLRQGGPRPGPVGKLAVVTASNRNKGLADFQSEPRRASAVSQPRTSD